jgi:hypothetical protein
VRAAFGTPAEVTVVGGGLRGCPGLVVRRDTLQPDEITQVGDVRCTTPLRTAFDLARGPDREEAVVAVDRLANRHRFHPGRLAEHCVRHRGRRGVARIPDVLALAAPYSGYRYAKLEVYGERDRIVAELTRARARRATSPSAGFRRP